jgi:hypothetical protein
MRCLHGTPRRCRKRILLRYLATQPGLQLEENTDRAGRPGLSVSADDPPAGRGWRGRHVLVLDPSILGERPKGVVQLQRTQLAADAPLATHHPTPPPFTGDDTRGAS